MTTLALINTSVSGFMLLATLMLPGAAVAQQTVDTALQPTFALRPTFSGAEPQIMLAQQKPSNPPQTQPTNLPPEAKESEEALERVVRRFRIGVSGGVSLDPELIDIGAHAAFAPIFSRNVEFRPGFEFGLGEVTTMFAVNLDLLYFLPGSTRTTRWMPYIGLGPNFAVSHESFETPEDVEDENRFDFSDTGFEGGFNFIAGARSQRGMFFEMKATAYGVSTIRLLAGFNF